MTAVLERSETKVRFRRPGNVDLDGLRGHIAWARQESDHPKARRERVRWEQGGWISKIKPIGRPERTYACIAGHAVLEAGAEPDMNLGMASATSMVVFRGEVYPISHLARKILGLSAAQASVFFAAENTIEDLEHYLYNLEQQLNEREKENA